MSEDKNLKVRIGAQFGGLIEQLNRLQHSLSDALLGRRSKHRQPQHQATLRNRRVKNRRVNKAAKRARRMNRRPSKRPKGYR